MKAIAYCLGRGRSRYALLAVQRGGARTLYGGPTVPVGMKPGTKLEGLAVRKGEDAPVIQESYPDWVAKLAEPDLSLAALRAKPDEEATLEDMQRYLKLTRRKDIQSSNESSAA